MWKYGKFANGIMYATEWHNGRQHGTQYHYDENNEVIKIVWFNCGIKTHEFEPSDDFFGDNEIKLRPILRDDKGKII